MKVVLIGNRELARHVLAYLIDTKWDVVGAVAAGGQAANRQAGFVPFDELVEGHPIELIKTPDINDPAVLEQLRSLAPNLCICPGWHQIINKEVLAVPDEGFIGFHSSNLPRGRGGAPVNWNIIHGQPQITLSLFYYTEGVDAGNVITKERVDISNRDDVRTVLDKLVVAARDALQAVRDDLERGSVSTSAQDEKLATYRPRRQPQDGLVDWRLSANDIFNWVRAQTDPYPGAYSFINGKRVTIWSGETALEDGGNQPGSILEIENGGGLTVATGRGTYRIKRLQHEGLPVMWADDWADRFNVEEGSSFGREHAPRNWLYTGLRDASGGTDFAEATNVSPGNAGTVCAAIKSPNRSANVQVRASLNDFLVHKESRVCEGSENVQIDYTIPSRGSHTLKVEFLKGGDRIDVRYLKVYSPV